MYVYTDTNTLTLYNNVLEATDAILFIRFHAIIVSCEVGYEKPSPEIFKTALSKDFYITSHFFTVFAISAYYNFTSLLCKI